MKKLLLSLSVLGLICACTKPVTPSVELEKDSITVDFEGGTVTVQVTSNVETITTITYAVGQDWISLIPARLAGNGTLEFRINKYLDTDADRTATATVVGGGIEKTIAITQTHKPKPVATDLDLNRYSVNADVEGTSCQISVFTQGEWTATSDQDWCTIENGTGAGEGSFTINVAASTDYQYRTAKVSVVSGTLNREVVVEHVGTKIGDLVWANANVDDPNTFGANCEVRGKLYQYNTKVGYPSFSADDHGDPDTVMPDFPLGAFDSCAQEWAPENDPCPAGWRVPTIDELKILVGKEDTTPHFYFDYWKDQGMSVAGAFVGIDRETAKTCTREDKLGAIFIPQAGVIHRDNGKQEDWWDAALASRNCVGQTWDYFGLWMNGNQDCDAAWYGSRTALSVRCVLAAK